LSRRADTAAEAAEEDADVNCNKQEKKQKNTAVQTQKEKDHGGYSNYFIVSRACGIEFGKKILI